MAVKCCATSVAAYVQCYGLLPLLVVGLLSTGQEHVDHGAYSPKVSENAVDRTGILGTRATDLEWQNLDPDTSKARLRELVNTGIDANHDGFVSSDELKTWIFNNFRESNYDASRERFQDADVDNSGKVSWSEHLSEAWGMDEEDNELLHPADYADDRLLIKEDRLLFDAADSDHDGQLTFEEYFKFLHPQEHTEMHPFITQNALKARDKNNDGKISWPEYIRDVVPLDIRTKEEDELYETEKTHFDEVYDLDHDGYLSGHEIYNWLVPDDSNSAEFETKHLMDVSDANKDGLLSIDEILAKYKEFTGTGAADMLKNADKQHDAEEL